MAKWTPGGVGRPPSDLGSVDTSFTYEDDEGLHYRSKYAYHRNPAGDISKIFKMGQKGEISRIRDAERSPAAGHFRRDRATFIYDLTKTAWAAKRNCAGAILDHFGGQVLGLLVSEAQENMADAYEAVIAQERRTVNSSLKGWKQDDPSLSKAFDPDYVNATIDGQEVKVNWANKGTYGHKTYGDRFNTLAMKSIEYSFKAIDVEELDATPDRNSSEVLSVLVAIPLYKKATLKGRAGPYEKMLPSEDTQGYVKLFPMEIHARTEKSRGNKGKPWNLWRAIEYGRPAGDYRRVYVRNVEEYRPVKKDKDGKLGLEGSKHIVAEASSIIASQEWTVFMSRKWKWWEQQSVLINGEKLIEVDVNGDYEIGMAPIRKAIAGANGDFANMARYLDQLFIAPMTEAGYRLGTKSEAMHTSKKKLP